MQSDFTISTDNDAVILGLPRGVVALESHRAEWDIAAMETIDCLRRCFGEGAVDIQHVGSTSIPTIKAKPIIDIAVAVRDFSEALEREEQLKRNGFYYRSKNELPGQLLWAKGSYYDGTGNIQSHFIHVVRASSRQWREYICFRDYLRLFPQEAAAYEALKLRLQATPGIDRQAYVEAKADFIKEITNQAIIYFEEKK